VAVDWVPFELHPEIPPEGRSRDEVLPLAYRQRVEEGLSRMAKDVGLELKTHERLINSRPALQAAEYAREQGLFDPMHRLLFEAFWNGWEGRLGITVLRDLATQVGLDIPGMETAITGNRYGDYLDARRAEAEELMIDGIPAHVIADRYLVMGAQPYGLFERVMARVGVQKRLAESS